MSVGYRFVGVVGSIVAFGVAAANPSWGAQELRAPVAAALEQYGVK